MKNLIIHVYHSYNTQTNLVEQAKLIVGIVLVIEICFFITSLYSIYKYFKRKDESFYGTFSDYYFTYDNFFIYISNIFGLFMNSIFLVILLGSIISKIIF